MVGIYFTDWEYTREIQEEEKREIQRDLYFGGIKNITLETIVNSPPFTGFPEEKYFDVLFFDAGGVMDVAYSTVSNFISAIIKAAENAPEKYFVVTSTFAMLIAEFKHQVKTEFNTDLPNIFYSIDDFINYYKKYNV